MGHLLRKRLFIHFFFCLAFLMGVATQPTFGQSAGDVAFTGYDGDSEGFAVVLFASYDAGDEIHFSSQEWDGTDFVGTGGDFTWVAPAGGTTKGTMLVFSDVGGTPSVNTGSIIDDADMSLLVSGDVIYAYTGADKSNPDTPFLGAIATDGTLYTEPDGTEGTLENTGLTEAGNETITLTTSTDVAEFLGDRSGNTPNGYRDKLIDTRNWQEEAGSGDQQDLILPFNETSFTIVSPPTISFNVSKIEADESQGLVPVTVELVEANSSAVDVDVVFLPTASTATNGDDFANYSTQTVSFSASDGNGTTQTVSIDITADGDFEQPEKAVFQLQNISTGTIIEPSELTLTIKDDDAPDVVFNEINADPGGDANNDGVVGDPNSDEFIEWVNNSGQDIDISGWIFADDNTDRYTFPEGATIGASNAIVLFDNDGGNVFPKGNFGAAVVYSDGELGLNNTPETLTLKDADGNIVSTATYDNDASGESNNLDPDGTGTSYVDHSTLSGGSLSSPGTKIDGTAFGSKYATSIRGSEGWRMISSPVQNATFNDLFNQFWVQGISGSDDPSGPETLLSWTESGGGSFDTPSDMSNSTLTPGKGYILYVFEDDEFNQAGIQGGFPKVVNTNGTENTDSDVSSIPVTANDSDGQNGIDGEEGWNLLGNPYGMDISVDALFTALETASMTVNTNIYVWDHGASGGADYIELSKGDGERLAPFQAFWVRYTQVGNDDISLNREDLAVNTGTKFYKSTSNDPISFNLELYGEDDYFDTYSVEFSEKGSTELDRYDGYHLFSLDANSINLYSTLSNNRLQKNVLPRDLESNMEIPLSFQANGRTALTFRWDKIKNIPNGWDVMLIDKELNEEINLRASKEYKFNITGQEQQKPRSQNKTLLNKATNSNDKSDSRFVLSVKPNVGGPGSGEIPNAATLNPNYPNPFNPTTTLSYELSEDAEVTLTVWNMIGQRVATLVDRQVEAGEHQETWNAANMPSGIYIARFQVGAEVFTRKMTLIK